MTNPGDLEPGRMLAGDRYTIIRLLARDGAGSLYLALDEIKGGEVAIKILGRPLPDDPARAEEPRDWLRGLVRLSHPHLVPVLDVGEHGGRPFVVLAYFLRRTLRDLLAVAGDGRGALRHPSPVEGWLDRVAGALDYLHGRDYFHGGLRPDTILIDRSGAAFLVPPLEPPDYLMEAGPEADPTMAVASIVGNPAYMAPETIQWRRVGGPTDQYSLAVIVFEAFAGRRPFMGGGMQIMMAILQAPPPDLRAFNSEVTSGVAAAVSRSLSKDPGDRYPDCSSFAREVLGPDDAEMSILSSSGPGLAG